MAYSLGNKIHALRRAGDMTQEALAEQMNVSPQAVSKWENDLSAPDVGSLPRLAQVLGVTVDELLGVERRPEVRLVPEGERDASKLTLHVLVDTSDGDKVRINLPVPLIQAAMDIGMSMPQVTASLGSGPAGAMRGIDIGELLALVEKGAVGKLVEVECGDGDVVSITVD